jgi:hypothetical protein
MGTDPDVLISGMRRSYIIPDFGRTVGHYPGGHSGGERYSLVFLSFHGSHRVMLHGYWTPLGPRQRKRMLAIFSMIFIHFFWG